MRPRHLLLWDALTLSGPEDEKAWREWRERADLNRLDRSSFQMLPLLSGKLDAWLAGDAQASIILGICRRAWSQRQLALRAVHRAIEALERAGVDPVIVTGPLVWAELYWPSKAIRPVAVPDLLAAPAILAHALAAFKQAGWTRLDSRRNYLHLRSASGDQVRLITSVAPMADLPFVRASIPELRTVEVGGVTVSALPAEYELITALAGHDDDAIDWRCDAATICRAAHIDWERVGSLSRWRSQARRRIAELREWAPDEVPANAIGSAGVLEHVAGLLRRTAARPRNLRS